MSFTFDFDTIPGQVFNGTLPANTLSVVATIPLQTASFALSSGRVVVVDVEAIGLDSAGNPVAAIGTAVVSGGSPPVKSGSSGLVAYGNDVDPGFSINGSGDLNINWFNTSLTLTHTISMRVNVRWVG